MQNEWNFLGQVRLRRGLGLWRATSRGLGVVAATVVFTLLGQVVDVSGSLAPLAILLAALLVVVNGLGYAELAASSPRPGGAYILVRDRSGSGGLAFFTGWALALSGLGLCGLLAQGAARYLSLLLGDFLKSPITLETVGTLEVLAMALAALVALESGLRRQRERRLPFTLPMVILLLALALAAAPRLPPADYRAVYPQPGPAMVLLMAAFVGLEIIVGHHEESCHWVVNLPRALLLAPVLVAALGVTLAAVAGPHAVAVTGAPLVPLGEAVAGATGRAVVLALGCGAMILSLGVTMTMVIRHLYVMSRDGFWPEWLRQTHPRRGVPVRLILLVGFLTLPVVWVPTALLGRISGFLYLFALMAVNLTLARRPRPETPSSFALPFHPWVPALVLAVDLLIIPLWGVSPIAWALVCLAVGWLVYLAYGRGHHIEAQEGITLFRAPTGERAVAAFRVLVPIANPATAGTLLRLAGWLAQSQGGEVLALQVAVVPDALPLEAGRYQAQAGRAVLEKVLALANEENLPVQTMTRVARSAAQGILDTAIEEKANLILLGWRGPAGARAASPGPIVDAVLRDAPCDVLVVRIEEDRPLRKILVPTAGGVHAQVATRLALSMTQAFPAEVTLLCVQPRPATPWQMEENRCKIAQTLEGLTPQITIEQKVVLASSVVEGIVQEAQGYDLVLLGVSEESLLDRLAFGSVPLQVAARVPAAALVQGYRGFTGVWTRRFVRALRDTLPALSGEEQLEVHQELSHGTRPGINYYVLTILSCIIAALGLLLNSPAVIIGAMLVAPLMSPILGLSLALVLGDLRLIRFSVEAIFKGVALAVVTAAFIGLLSPLKLVTTEMLARARPNLLDMAVALAAGMAGAYAVARKDVSAALPGVAIAAALMPPLATAGLGLSLGELHMAGGAFLLFATNLAAIGLAGSVVFLLLGIRPQTWGPESRRQLRQRLIASLILLLAIAVPLAITMSGVVRDAAQERTVREVLTQHLTAGEEQLVALEVERNEADLLVVATVRSARPFDQEAVDGLAAALSRRLSRRARLEMVVLPVVRSDRE
jgi:uncharacterized hydrophobic protein (TIGR00271 family)